MKGNAVRDYLEDTSPEAISTTDPSVISSLFLEHALFQQQVLAAISVKPRLIDLKEEMSPSELARRREYNVVLVSCVFVFKMYSVVRW